MTAWQHNRVHPCSVADYAQVTCVTLAVASIRTVAVLQIVDSLVDLQTEQSSGV